MQTIHKLCVLVGLLFAPATTEFVRAQDADVAATNADWVIGPDDDSGACFMSRDFEGTGNTVFSASKRLDGVIILQLNNASWRPDPQQRTGFNIELNGKSYPVVGIRLNLTSLTTPRSGYAFVLPSDVGNAFMADLHASSTIHFQREGAMIEHLRTDGAHDAIVALEGCLERMRHRRSTSN